MLIPEHEEIQTVLAAGVEKTITFPGSKLSNGRKQIIRRFTTDEGAAAGGALVKDVRCKLIPSREEASGRFGGNVFHTFAAQKGTNFSNNFIELFDAPLGMGVDMDVTLVSATGGTFVFRLERYVDLSE